MGSICLIDSMKKTRLNLSFHVTKKIVWWWRTINIQHVFTSVLTLTQTVFNPVGLQFLLFLQRIICDRLSLWDQLGKGDSPVDMVVISFPFNVFLKLQLLLQFTNCFEEKNRSWTWKSGDILASKTNQVLNLQYVSPRLKYISGESKPWEPRILDDQAETVSGLKLF